MFANFFPTLEYSPGNSSSPVNCHTAKKLQEVRTQNQTEMSTKSQELGVHLLKLFMSMMTIISILPRSVLINTQIQAKVIIAPSFILKVAWFS